MKRYQWVDEELKKKYKRYNNFALLAMLVTLVSLYLLPQELKLLNMAFIGAGAIFLVLAFRVQGQDRNIKQGELEHGIYQLQHRCPNCDRLNPFYYNKGNLRGNVTVICHYCGKEYTR